MGNDRLTCNSEHAGAKQQHNDKSIHDVGDDGTIGTVSWSKPSNTEQGPYRYMPYDQVF